ncbi:hypothetical protein OPT61_g10499 [Boeremia exigua]|uniref:Uncharacterized protein n=1 Tax=Boeremia exigua TaxID=749465 RepID=A0ACC2HPS5_9PLEO|nr:hypothetical protein OPT61_g10499 [Boeremia exigua]
MQRFADQIAPLRRDVIIHLPKDHDQLALNLARAPQRIIVLPRPQRRAVDVRCEITHRGCDARVECAPEREVAAETHAWGRWLAAGTAAGTATVAGTATATTRRVSRNVPVAPTRPLHVPNPNNTSTANLASSSYASTFFSTFHAFPASVPGPSYASGSGPVNSWYEEGAATM